MLRLPIDSQRIVTTRFVGKIVDNRPSDVNALSHAAHRRDHDIVTIAEGALHELDRARERATHECTCMNDVSTGHERRISFPFEGNEKT